MTVSELHPGDRFRCGNLVARLAYLSAGAAVIEKDQPPREFTGRDRRTGLSRPVRISASRRRLAISLTTIVEPLR